MGGVGPYLDLACRSGTVRSIERNVKARQADQRWTDAENILTLVMLNLVGGDCINARRSSAVFTEMTGK